MIVKNLFRIPDSVEGAVQAAPAVQVAAPVVEAISDQQKIDNALAKSKPDDAPKGAAKNVKPMMAKEPPKEILEKEIGIEDDDIAMFDEGKPKSEKKVEAKKEEAPVKTKVEVKVTPVVEVAKERDYAGYSPEETSALKQMSNPAFEFATGLIKQLKAIPKEGQLPATYYEHPQAYTLSPDYQKAQGELALVDKESAHWRQQLLNIRAGKPWTNLKGFDSKTGEPVFEGPYKATDDAEIDISNALASMQTVKGQIAAKIDGYKTTFKQGVDYSVQQINKVQAERFSWVADPKLLDEKVDIGGGKVETIKNVQSAFKNMFPAFWHNNPLIDVGANMFVGLQIYAAKIRELEAQVGKTQKEKEQITRMEPVVEGAAGNGKGVSKDDFVFTAEEL